MAREMKLPELGENIESAEVVTVLVSAGDQVEADQPVVELETDKATAEVPATFGGVVREVRVKAGDQVRVGQVLLTLDDTTAGADVPGTEAPSAPAKDSPPPPETATVEPTATVTDDIVAASPASAPSRQSPSTKAPAAPAANASPAPPPSAGDPVPASPAVRRLARELGIDVSSVTGSQTGGRISAEDVKAHARSLIGNASSPTAAPAMATTTTAAAALPDFSRWGAVEREPMSGIRRRTAENLSRAWQTIPLVTQFDRADITSLESFRKQYGPRVQAAGGKLTPTAMVLKIAAAALRRFPTFNASLDLAAQEIVVKKFINIGVAVETERGLLVPVIKDADRKSLQEIAVELTDLASRARDRKVTIDDLSGGTFTVTNLGGLGTTYFSPLVNWPEVAILGIGRARVEPSWEDDAWQPRKVMPLSVSYDHRLIDGADAARFARWLAEAIENPYLMLLEG